MQEIRIPWSLLYTKVPPINPGMKFRMIGEFFWGSPQASKWPQFIHQDPMTNPDRTNTYKSPQNWGIVELIGHNNIKTEEPSVRDFKENYVHQAAKIQGVIPIRFEVPKNAKKFTVAIDKDGKRYRNLVGNVDVDLYTVDRKGDMRVVEVLWDGRKENSFNYDWDEFVGNAKGTCRNNIGAGPNWKEFENMVVAEPGEYTARIIVHDGMKAIYEGNFYNPGNPPWPSADGSGGWLGDHHAPSFVSALPKSGKSKNGTVFMSSPGGECGVPFIGIDKSGEKIWSWVRQTSKVMAHGANDTHVFFGFTYAGRLHWGKVDADTGVQATFGNGLQDLKLPDNRGARFAGFDVHGSTVAIALGEGGVIFCNTESGDQLKYFPDCKHVGQIRYLPDGKRLVGLKNYNELVTVNVEDAAVEKIELDGITTVSAFAVDSRGRLYVADVVTEKVETEVKGKKLTSIRKIGDQTVKVFDAARSGAKQIAEIGAPGGRKPGPYNKLAINQPVSMAVEERADGQFRLWIVEKELGHRGDRAFRRQSVWNVTDLNKIALHREYVGNAIYQGSGGSLSDDDPTLGLYRGTLFRLDYEKYTYEPIYIMEEGGGTGERSFGNGYHFWSNVSGKKREYYVAGQALFLNTASGWKHVYSAPSVRNGYLWGFRCYKDLTWYVGGVAYRPKSFTEEGAPVYGEADKLPGELGQHNPSPRNDTFKTTYGYLSMKTTYGPNPERVTWNCPQLVGFDNEGTCRWTYPSFWWSVHGCSTALMAKPGRIIGQLKWLGLVEVNGRTYIATRGYKGQDFYIRDDGMYVSELFRDFRECDKIMPDDKKVRGLDISDTSLNEEIFSGWMAKQSDGIIRTTWGHTDVRIAQVHGLETVRDLPDVKVVVTPEHLPRLAAFVPTMGKKVIEYTVAKGGAFDLNNVDFSSGALKIREVSKDDNVPLAKLRYDQENLYIAYQVTGDATPWQHAPDQGFQTLFKSGDAVGFFHHLDGLGGTRIVMASPGGKDVAVVHRPRGPGSAPYVYTSPVRSVEFKYVAKEPAISFKVKKSERGYVLVAAVPWKVIGAQPTSGLKFRGDLEVMFGSEQSSHVQKLLRWVDPVDSIHDLPTEAELQPQKFGTFILE